MREQISRWYNDIWDYMLMKEFGTEIFVYNCQLTMKSKLLSLLPEFEFFWSFIFISVRGNAIRFIQKNTMIFIHKIVVKTFDQNFHVPRIIIFTSTLHSQRTCIFVYAQEIVVRSSI